ncbi:ribonuclease H-like domain-containing protein [Tanacetum coccineum]
MALLRGSIGIFLMLLGLFSFKIDQPVQDVTHLNVFNSDLFDDLSKMPNIEERRRPSLKRHGNHPPRPPNCCDEYLIHPQEETHQSTDNVQPVRRCLINLVVQKGRTLYQMDINNAFLYMDLSETVYMSLSPGYFPSDEKKVCKLNSNNVFIALLGYVDDIIVDENNISEIEKFKRKYPLDLIAEFGLLAGKPSLIPLQPNISLSSEPCDTDPKLKIFTKYQKLIGNKVPKRVPCKGLNIVKSFASDIDIKAYSDVDWASKKQNAISKSSTEVEY